MARHRLIGVMLALMIATAGADENEGKAVFQRWCVHCHGDQPSAPGRLRLVWNRGEEFSRLAQRHDLDAATIARVVRHGQLEMPALRKTELCDIELATLIQYLTRKTLP